MFIVIPYSTDAPIYYFPWGTLGLIAVNFVCFVVNGGDHDPWMLHFGQLNPIEWLSNIFTHGNWVHLLGNLYFLWLFGIIVEGKLGWRRFIPLYLAIGIGESAASQLLMWRISDGTALGASGAIMGLMALCLVWAPRNELSIMLVLFIWPRFFDVTILAFAGFYLFWDFVGLALSGFSMSTPALHLTGAVLGCAAGLVYVKKGWVDCENWDLVAVMKGTHGRFGDETTTVGSHADASLLFGQDVDTTTIVTADSASGDRLRRKPGKKSLRTINELIDSGKFMDASEQLFNLRLRDSDAHPDRSRLKRLAFGLFDANALDEAEMFLEEYIDRFPEESDACHLRLAHIQLDQRSRPAASLRTLKNIRLSRLTPEQQRRARQAVTAAKKQIQDGVEDAEDEFDW